MSKTIVLMRHGSYDGAVDSYSYGNLTERGKTQTQDIAQQIIEADVIPDLILYAPSPRTQQTAETIAMV